MPRASAPPRRPLLASSIAALALIAAGAATAGCTSSLSDEARAVPAQEDRADAPFASPTCEAVRAGIAAYNAGDLPRSLQAFSDAVPLARTRAQRMSGRDGSMEAQDLLEAVEYYAGLSTEQLGEAFPASPETRRYQDVTLSQCQPLPSGLDGEGAEDEQSEQPA